MMTALLVLASLALFITFVTSIITLALNIVVARDVRDVLTLSKINTTREAVMDRTLTTMASTLLSMFPPGYPPMGPMGVDPYAGRTGGMSDLNTQPPAKRPHVSESFETEDGRHSDPTLKGLLEKILGDPNYKITKPEDMEKLNDLFKRATEQPPQDPRDPPTYGSSGGVFPTPEKPPLPPPPRRPKDDLGLDMTGFDDFEEEDEDDGA